MNHHLNLFRFFHESQEKIFIENNLSRAFALCLQNSSLFLNEYLRKIVSDEDFEYLFSSLTDGAELVIDVQIETGAIEIERYKTVYAVAMTTDRSLNLSNFFNQPEFENKLNLTDILITLKDIAIVIEVKRTEEDCVRQLFNQVLPFIRLKDKITTIPKNFAWQDVVKILERVKNVQQLVLQNSVFINHFLDLSEAKYSHWFEPKPFNVLPFASQYGTTEYRQLEKRIKQAMAMISTTAGEGYQPLIYNDRMGISVPFGWASEVIPDFRIYNDNVKEYLTLYIWPGNTKSQGHSIYNKPLDWMHKKSLTIEGQEYELEIEYNIKFSHFMGKFVTEIEYDDKDIKKQIHTQQNFWQSGRWDCSKWPELESFFDDHFTEEFNWRRECNWQDNFINSGRNYVFMSLGFQVAVFIPFSKLKEIDKREADIIPLSNFIFSIVQAFKTLI